MEVRPDKDSTGCGFRIYSLTLCKAVILAHRGASTQPAQEPRASQVRRHKQHASSLRCQVRLRAPEEVSAASDRIGMSRDISHLEQ